MTAGVRWQRADTGALLLLRRDGQTIALVVGLDDRKTYTWLHDGERSQPYNTEQEACDSLFSRLLNVQRSRRALFLRLGARATLGLVAQNDDGTYKWFVPGNPKNNAVFQNENDAYNALCDALGLAA